MSDILKFTPEQKRAQLARAEAEAQRFAADAKKMREELGISEGSGGESSGGSTGIEKLTRQQSDEEALAAAFAKMAPGEVLDLYNNQPEVWRKMMDAVERVGARRLFRR